MPLLLPLLPLLPWGSLLGRVAMTSSQQGSQHMAYDLKHPCGSLAMRDEPSGHMVPSEHAIATSHKKKNEMKLFTTPLLYLAS